jgi:hypothetical protein
VSACPAEGERTIDLWVHDAFVALTSRELGDKAKDFAKAILSYWPSSDEAPPAVTGDAVFAVKDASDDASLATALRAFVDTASPSLEPERIWADAPLGVLLRGLFSVAKQYLRSTDAQEALSLCNDIRAAVDDRGRLAGHPNELVAALMVVEDAIGAIEGYADAAPFNFVDEAYLAKYGLLQALQVAFDGAESAAKVLGVRLRADRKGGKAAIVARNIVAGHPIGGNMDGQAWHHFHDRATAHDKAIIRVMSFSRSDPERWTGQTVRTGELIKDGLRAIKQILRDALNDFATTRDT